MCELYVNVLMDNMYNIVNIKHIRRSTLKHIEMCVYS